LVNVALQVTDLEAQVDHWRKRVEALVKERDAALAKVKSEEKQSQLTKDQ
jgi:ssDNA-binding replication factor A large subunit